MRSDEDKKYITDNLIDPFSIEGFLSADEVNELTDIFDRSNDMVVKNTKTVSVKVDFYNTAPPQIFKTIIERLEAELGPFEVFSSLFFKAVYPHVIHNDDNYDCPLLHRAITLPLRIESPSEQYPSLCFFDQYYLDGPAKFFKGHSATIDSYYNEPVYEYSKVLNKQPNGITEVDVLKYFSHLDPKWLEELSLKSVIPWVPGNALVFDCARLHAASDFRKLGITSKLGLSIFTKVKKT